MRFDPDDLPQAPILTDPKPAPVTPREQVLTDASALIVGDRQADYGPPEVNFERIATIWRVLFPERAWTPADVALAMFGVKIGRAVQGYKRDTAVDMAGYAALWAELAETA